jgi:hypothetical protein
VRRSATVTALALGLLVSLPGTAAAAVTPGPTVPSLSTAGDVGVSQPPVTSYGDPSFDCRFHHYGEGERPRLSEMNRDPLCVEYEKRDITLSNGGALRFALAEPARVLVALPACRYWQIDHWRAQLSPGDDSVLRWDGSYWFDKARRTAGGAMYRFRLAGQVISASRAASLVRPVSPQAAQVIEQFGVSGGMGTQLTQIGPREQAACTRPGA